MKKLLYILALIPALLSAQTYNVSITNSLLGPVTLEFTNTQVTASGAVVTGTVINAAITNTFSASVTNEFSASVTNTFAPVNNITNEITVGGTTVNNTNTFITYVTNQVDVAGVVNNVYITNITQTILTTAGVQSISFTGAVDGAITLAGNAVTQTGTTFNISYVDLGYTSIVSQGSGNVVTNILGLGSRIITQQLGTISASGGGLNHWSATNGGSTQRGSFLYPTSDVPAFSGTTLGLFVATNGAISLNVPDGGINGGSARGQGAIDLQPSIAGSLSPRAAASQSATAERGVLIGTYRSTAGGTYGSVVIGGANGAQGTISSGEGNTIIGGGMGTITAGNNNFIGGGGGNAIAGGNVEATVGSTSVDINSGLENGVYSSFDGNIQGTSYRTAIIGSETANLNITNSSFSSACVIMSSENVRMISFGNDRTRAATIMSALNSTNAGRGSVVAGYQVTSTNDGNFVFQSWDSGTSRFTVGVSNVAAFKVRGFGINTNNPQEALHVDGKVQILGVKIYASGTNLYLTDGATYTNRINVTPE